MKNGLFAIISFDLGWQMLLSRGPLVFDIEMFTVFGFREGRGREDFLYSLAPHQRLDQKWQQLPLLV